MVRDRLVLESVLCQLHVHSRGWHLLQPIWLGILLTVLRDDGALLLRAALLPSGNYGRVAECDPRCRTTRDCTARSRSRTSRHDASHGWNPLGRGDAPHGRLRRRCPRRTLSASITEP